MKNALKVYVIGSAGLGFWIAREADLNPWQTAATVILAPAVLAGAIVHEVRLAVFER